MKLQFDEPLSKNAYDFNLRRYSEVPISIGRVKLMMQEEFDSEEPGRD